MNIYIVSKNCKAESIGYTSLKELCMAYGFSYASASKGKSVYLKEDIFQITKVLIKKIKGRGNIR